MNRRTKSIVTMAASLCLGASGFAMGQNTGTDRNGGGAGMSGGSSTGMGGSGGAMNHSDGRMHMNGGGADAQVKQQLQMIAQDPGTAPDKLFVLGAGMGNQWEIELAKAVQQKAQNDQVKQLAQQIEQDHTQAQQKLQSVASSMSIQLPQQLGEEKQQKLQIFNSLPADKMEKQYLCMMQADHAKDVTEYMSVSQTADNQQVKQYASEVLPKLKMHASHVDSTAVAMGLPASPIASALGGSDNAMPASGRMGGNNMDGTTNNGAGGLTPDTNKPDPRGSVQSGGSQKDR